METIIFLSQFWGFSLIAVSLALLMQPKHIERLLQLAQNSTHLLVFGITNIMLGVALLSAYHTWDKSLFVIITILNCLVLIRGLLLVFFTEHMQMLVSKLHRKTDWLSYILVVTTILGCVLVYASYGA